MAGGAVDKGEDGCSEGERGGDDGMFGVAFEARELSRSVSQGGSSSAARTSMRGGGGGGILAVVRAVQPGQQYKGH